MPHEIQVPPVGESITEVQIGEWLKKEGESAKRDEPVVMIETDKVTVELPAPVGAGDGGSDATKKLGGVEDVRLINFDFDDEQHLVSP